MVGSTLRIGGGKYRSLLFDAERARDAPWVVGEVRRYSGALEGMERERPVGTGTHPERIEPDFTVAGTA